MPRITADTVVAHRAHQREALLGAARALLAETGATPSMAAVGRRAGLARSSVYQYFPSAEELLNAVVADVFPDWTRRVRSRIAEASTPGEQIWAYVEANVDLLAGTEHALAQTLRRVVTPDVLHGPMSQFHANLQEPLHQALRAYGEAEVAPMAELINAVIAQASRGESHDGGTGPIDAAQRAAILARLRRLLAGYLAS